MGLAPTYPIAAVSTTPWERVYLYRFIAVTQSVKKYAKLRRRETGLDIDVYPVDASQLSLFHSCFISYYRRGDTNLIHAESEPRVVFRCTSMHQDL